MNTGDELLEVLSNGVAGRDPLATGARILTGTVTDISVWPPLIDTGGGPIATPCLHGYRPVVADFVHVLTDWNGKFSGSRICIGPIAKCAALQLERTANQSATTVTAVSISWDTETRDMGWGFTPTGATITVPTGASGSCAITTEVVGAGNFADGSYVRIRAPLSIRTYPFFLSSANVRMAASIVVDLGSTDTFDVQVFNNGATQNFTAHLEARFVA